MAGTVIADNLQAAATSTLVIKNGVANTPPTIQDSAGTTIGTFCRAWVNFNGTGTVAINASFNVSSITDNGTGDYTVNFTTALVDANYAVTTIAPVISDQGSPYQFGLRFPPGLPSTPTLKSTTQVRVLCRRESDFDLGNANVAIFR
jgi:hypothetical protein